MILLAHKVAGSGRVDSAGAVEILSLAAISAQGVHKNRLSGECLEEAKSIVRPEDLESIQDLELAQILLLTRVGSITEAARRYSALKDMNPDSVSSSQWLRDVQLAVANCQGQYDVALQVCLDAQAHAEALGRQDWAAIYCLNALSMKVEQEEPAAALHMARSVRHMSTKIGMGLDMAQLWIQEARAMSELGRLEEADRLFDQSVQRAQLYQDFYLQAGGLRGRSYLAAPSGRSKEALELANASQRGR